MLKKTLVVHYTFLLIETIDRPNGIFKIRSKRENRAKTGVNLLSKYEFRPHEPTEFPKVFRRPNRNGIRLRKKAGMIRYPKSEVLDSDFNPAFSSAEFSDLREYRR